MNSWSTQPQVKLLDVLPKSSVGGKATRSRGQGEAAGPPNSSQMPLFRRGYQSVSWGPALRCPELQGRSDKGARHSPGASSPAGKTDAREHNRM